MISPASSVVAGGCWGCSFFEQCTAQQEINVAAQGTWLPASSSSPLLITSEGCHVKLMSCEINRISLWAVAILAIVTCSPLLSVQEMGEGWSVRFKGRTRFFIKLQSKVFRRHLSISTVSLEGIRKSRMCQIPQVIQIFPAKPSIHFDSVLPCSLCSHHLVTQDTSGLL